MDPKVLHDLKLAVAVAVFVGTASPDAGRTIRAQCFDRQRGTAHSRMGSIRGVVAGARGVRLDGGPRVSDANLR
jgi:hypothetical protein